MPELIVRKWDGPYSFMVFKEYGLFKARRGDNGEIQFEDTDGAVVLQNALNEGGIIFVKDIEISTSENVKTILATRNSVLQGSGIDKTILKCGDGIQQTVIEMDDYATVRDLTVDGNYRNNLQGEAGWENINDVPFAQGIYTSKYLTSGNVGVAAYQPKVERVKIRDTLRSCLVVTGEFPIVKEVRLRNSYTDHALYISSSSDGLVDAADCSGMSSEECVSIGYSSRNTLRKIFIRDLAEGKWGYPHTALVDRSTSSRTKIEDLTVVDDDPDRGVYVAVSGERSVVEKMRIRTRGVQSYVLVVNGLNAEVRDFDVEITDDDQTTTAHTVYVNRNCKLFDGRIKTVGTHWYGLTVFPAEAIDNLIVRNVDIDVPDGVNAIRVVGDTYEVDWQDINVRLLTSTIVAETGTVKKLFWNKGTATGTGAQQAIAHGCAFTPTKAQVILTNIDDGANPYLSADPDATNIYVTAVSGKEYRWEVRRNL